MDRFDALRVFVRIVERRSFTRAAEDLALPRATVTDAIKALESRLGVRLLQRTTRQVSLTLEGEIFYARCLRLIADMEDAEGAFRDTRPKGPLRIEVHGTLARHLLFPRLPAFLEAYPDIELDVSEGDRYVDLVREGVDCAVRVGELRDSDLVARRLTLLPEATAASPAYCKRHGTPTDVDTLETGGHVMVGFKSTAIGALLPLEFQQEGRVRHLTLPTRVRVSGAESYVGAAFAGFGIIQAPRYRLDGYFATGALVPLLERFPPLPSPVNIVYARTRLPSPRLRAFIDWASGVFDAG
ncbi:MULTISPECIES: LysR family transcriptional regulator [unclassified Pseudoxanthomonas]|uniref:LysR family transcriptional regulator n=1 Tax=unclassified Pseudoxanthomonas TaxID=2645906 RepID=UPI00161B4BC0|nr:MULTISPECIES: LysR family transcriptional regulator [unclassified Pseudoxanthomonas]MBB3274991.1 DNA-binding transcriptional LysR family regulator [Pseudoxanthomonas sp. OG2]MBV7473916.1 LysR family transcriptional regulator [Pseudoxanthomonas sp. PXM05]